MVDDWRFNPNHVPAGSSTGGQFGSAEGQTAQQKLSAEKEPAPSHGSGRYGKTWRNGAMAYDPKGNIGPGYGMPNGDPDVHKLQAALNRLGLTDNQGHPLKLDGKLGPLTTQAIKSAQKALGMPTDGKVTRALFDKLTNLKSLPAAEKVAKKATKAAEGSAPKTVHKLVKARGFVDSVKGNAMFEVNDRAQMSTQDINDLPDSDFAYIEEGGSKDSSGKTVPRSLRHFPINDADHVRNALSRAPQSPFGDKAMPKILAAAKKFGIQVSDNSTGRSEEFSMIAVERRFTLMTVEMRTPPGEQPRIGGYAAMFSKVSQNLGGFVEVVERSFFNKSRGDGWPDVMCRYNHDDNMLLGTTGAGTLRLGLDETGLDYNVTPPNSRADVVELVHRGDVRKSSFAFRVPTGGEDWGLSDQGYPMRHLLTGQLVDVAPVNVPAYLDTSAAMRSLALKMDADEAEVRSLAAANELRRFFIRTDNVGPGPKKKPQLLGAAAAVQLLARRQDPWAE